MNSTPAPKVTVIIPAYRAAEQLDFSVGSLQAQTLRDFEVIIVEDCSADDGATLRKAEEIAARDPRFKVAQTSVNSGCGPARNVGIELAKGEYIAFLDADDSLAPEALEELYRLARLHDADQVCYAMEIHNASGKVLNRHNDPNEQVFRDPTEIKEFTLNTLSPSFEPGRPRYPGFTNSRFYRRSLLMEHNVRFPAERHFLSEDFPFVYESMRHVRTFVFTYNSWYRYTISADSITRNPREDMIERAVRSAEYFAEMVRRDPEAPAVGVHNAWGYVVDAVRSYVKLMFMSSRSLGFKRQWMRRQAEIPLFRTIYEQYPWRRMPFKHRLGFSAFYHKRFLLLYALVVGQEKLRALLGTTK